MKLIEIQRVSSDSDNRGFAARPVDEKELKAGHVSNIHIVSMKPGVVRGNHYHIKQKEKIWLIGGPCKVIARNRNTGETEEEIFDGNEQILLVIPPDISHAIKNISDGITYLFCYSNFSPTPDDKDVFRDELVK